MATNNKSNDDKSVESIEEVDLDNLLNLATAFASSGGSSRVKGENIVPFLGGAVRAAGLVRSCNLATLGVKPVVGERYMDAKMWLPSALKGRETNIDGTTNVSQWHMASERELNEALAWTGDMVSTKSGQVVVMRNGALTGVVIWRTKLATVYPLGQIKRSYPEVLNLTEWAQLQRESVQWSHVEQLLAELHG